MNILSITAQKPHSTGSGIYLTELVSSFNRAGHKQAVVAGVYHSDEVIFPEGVSFYPVYFSESSEDNSQADIPFPIVGMSDEMPYVSTRYRDMDESMVACFGEAFMKVIAKAIDELQPDIILCHHLFLLTAMVRRTFPHIPIYGISHGSDIRQTINCPHLKSYIKPEIMKLNKIFVLHREQKQQIVSLIDERIAYKIQIIGSGYNTERFNTIGRQARNPKDPIKLCFAGKMSAAKGIYELLDVLELLDADKYLGKLPKFTVTLAGGCQDDKVLKRLEDYPSSVKYIGQIPQAELARIFKESDIFILPSYFEGLPLVLIEAMASGMLPISTDLPGFKDWIDENVDYPNIRYVPMPEMSDVDVPSDAGRKQFKLDLKSVIENAILDIDYGTLSKKQPVTSNISWDAVAAKIL